MALHRDFPDSPYTILDPDIRWFPADEVLRCALDPYARFLVCAIAELDGRYQLALLVKKRQRPTNRGGHRFQESVVRDLSHRFPASVVVRQFVQRRRHGLTGKLEDRPVNQAQPQQHVPFDLVEVDWARHDAIPCAGRSGRSGGGLQPSAPPGPNRR